LVAGSAIAAVVIKRGKGVLAPVHVIEWTEEELTGRRPQEFQAEASVRQADPVIGDCRDLVTVIAVDSTRGRPPSLAKVEIGWIIEGDRRCMAGCTDTGSRGVLPQQTPTDAGPSLPIAAIVEVQKAAVANGA